MYAEHNLLFWTMPGKLTIHPETHVATTDDGEDHLKNGPAMFTRSLIHECQQKPANFHENFLLTRQLIRKEY